MGAPPPSAQPSPPSHPIRRRGPPPRGPARPARAALPATPETPPLPPPPPRSYVWHVVAQFAALYALGGLGAVVWGGALRMAWVYHVTW